MRERAKELGINQVPPMLAEQMAREQRLKDRANKTKLV